MRAFIALALALLALAGCGGSRDLGAEVESLRQAEGPPLWWVGESFEGLALEDAEESGFIYGTCEAKSDQGCAPPLEIQNYLLSERHPSAFSVPRCRRVTVRGFPGAFFATSGGLDLYLGGRTIVLFGSSEARVLRAANALRPLREPAAGVMQSAPPDVIRFLERNCRPS